MSQLATDIAKALAVAAIQAQPSVFTQDARNPSDAAHLGREVAQLFHAIFVEVSRMLPRELR